jgi:hypothetical protein
VSATEPGALAKVAAHAMGPSFGTLCFSGAVVALVETIRRALNRSTNRRANRNRGSGGGGNPLALACMLFQCLLGGALQVQGSCPIACLKAPGSNP